MIIYTNDTKGTKRYVKAPDGSKIWCKSISNNIKVIYLLITEYNYESTKQPTSHQYQTIMDKKNKYGHWIIPEDIPSKYIEETKMAIIIDDELN